MSFTDTVVQHIFDSVAEMLQSIAILRPDLREKISALTDELLAIRAY